MSVKLQNAIVNAISFCFGIVFACGLLLERKEKNELNLVSPTAVTINSMHSVGSMATYKGELAATVVDMVKTTTATATMFDECQMRSDVQLLAWCQSPRD